MQPQQTPHDQSGLSGHPSYFDNQPSQTYPAAYGTPISQQYGASTSEYQPARRSTAQSMVDYGLQHQQQPGTEIWR